VVCSIQHSGVHLDIKDGIKKMSPTIIDKAELVAAVKARIAIANADIWKDLPTASRACRELLADEKQLERILIARKFQLDPSVDLLLEQVRFRAKIPTVLPSELPNALPSGAWRMMGYAKDGSPISNYRLEHWNPHEWEGTFEQTVGEYSKYVVYMIELMIASMKEAQPDKFTVLFDLNGFYFTMATESSRRHMIRKLIYVAQSQYPERLGRALLLNAPYGFQTAWALIKPLLDEKTAAKVQFVNSTQLLDYIDETVLSKDYGGTHAAYPVPSKTVWEEAQSIR
jgi:hypothetical protein